MRGIIAGLMAGLIVFPVLVYAQHGGFPGRYLSNASTGEPLEKDLWEVRISHRFVPNANKDRLDRFFGLNGPASVFLGVERGILDNVTVSFARTNYNQLQWELKYRIQKPLVSTFLASTSWNSNKSIVERRAYSFTFQGIAPVPIRQDLSAWLIPSYVLSLRSDIDDILALGIALSYRVLANVSLMMEWFPVLSGEIYGFDTWSLGIGKHIGWHDFTLVLTNSTGISASDYLRGGDLDIKEREFRLGFNILRKL